MEMDKILETMSFAFDTVLRYMYDNMPDCGDQDYIDEVEMAVNSAVKEFNEASANAKTLLSTKPKREFFVDTPAGQLKVWAKHETDTAADYPGVYVDLMPGAPKDGKIKHEPDIWGDCLAVVEYNSADNCLQTVVYQPGADEPVSITVHEDAPPADEDENEICQHCTEDATCPLLGGINCAGEKDDHHPCCPIDEEV